jgi:hypothetical protein
MPRPATRGTRWTGGAGSWATHQRPGAPGRDSPDSSGSPRDPGCPAAQGTRQGPLGRACIDPNWGGDRGKIAWPPIATRAPPPSGSPCHLSPPPGSHRASPYTPTQPTTPLLLHRVGQSSNDLPPLGAAVVLWQDRSPSQTLGSKEPPLGRPQARGPPVVKLNRSGKPVSPKGRANAMGDRPSLGKSRGKPVLPWGNSGEGQKH